MIRQYFIFCTALIALITSCMQPTGAEFHVSVTGSDQNSGTESEPLRTIQAAAELAIPGDVISVHEGVYRERVNPPRGGESDAQRITYRAVTGEKVEIKGSEVITGWESQGEGVWKVTLANDFFGEYNPYTDVILGDWFQDIGRDHHTGAVYLNGKSLYEMESLEKVSDPGEPLQVKYFVSEEPHSEHLKSIYAWYCENDEVETTIWANFHDFNPNKELVEINVREACFYPDQPGRNYLTVSGFRMSQAATQWAPPTAEQIGLLGTHWSKGWIIENNIISDSRCTGITLGKDRKTGQNVWLNDPAKDGATHYNEVVVRALEIGWSKVNIGSHIVRNNTIFNCGQAGICGSLGAAFSEISNNHIYNIWTKRQFRGAEIAGIKIHASIDALIKNNHVHHSGRGLWMDWMTQGTHLTGNICYNNDTDDLFVEVNHGPYRVDNNIFLSDVALRNWSEGGAFSHNIIAGTVRHRPIPGRSTPYHPAHSTTVAGLSPTTGGDDRYYNNMFVADQKVLPDDSGQNYRQGYGLAAFNADDVLPVAVGGNVYLNGATPYRDEQGEVKQAGYNPDINVVHSDGSVYLHLTLNPVGELSATQLVTTDLLGLSAIPKLPFENFDGSTYVVDTDLLGKKRDLQKPTAGPFENAGTGKLQIKLR
jgi:hypothetical protein